MLTQFITDFGDQAVVLPLAATVGATTALTGWRRGAIAWSGTVGLALFVMLVLKLLFAACGMLLLGHMLHSPSGHTAAAAVVYGGLATLVVGRTRQRIWPALGLATLFAVCIGLSRLSLGVHTLLEVIVGGAVGVTGAAILARAAGRPPPGWRLTPVFLAGALVLVLFHGLHLDAEWRIDAAAARLWPFSACLETSQLPAFTVAHAAGFR
jgi:membrane-associated phospholipid phosphatase